MAALFSLVATGVSGAYAIALLGRYRATRRRNRALLFWGIALAQFCIASAMLAAGAIGGWTPVTFRVFYLLGGVLNVPWLAMGSVVVNGGNRIVGRITGAVLLLVAALMISPALGDTPLLWVPAIGVCTVWALLLALADEDGQRAGSLALLVAFSGVATIAVASAALSGPVTGAGLPEGRELLAPAVRGLAVAGNTVGSLIVIVSAVASALGLGWQDVEGDRRDEVRELIRRRPVEGVARYLHLAAETRESSGLVHLVRGNLLIAAGVLVAAAGGAFSFLGETTGNAVGLGLGVTLMYLGFRRTQRRHERPAAPGTVAG